MRTVLRDRRVLGSLAVAALLVSVWVASRPGSVPRAGDRAVGGAEHGVVVGDGARTQVMAVRGRVAEAVRPGLERPVDVELHNRHAGPVRVDDLDVTIEAVSAPRATAALPCGPSDFVVSPADLDRSVVVAAGSRRWLSQTPEPRSRWPRFGMRASASNQDGCKGATVTLRYVSRGSAS